MVTILILIVLVTLLTFGVFALTVEYCEYKPFVAKLFVCFNLIADGHSLNHSVRRMCKELHLCWVITVTQFPEAIPRIFAVFKAEKVPEPKVISPSSSCVINIGVNTVFTEA